MNKIVTTLEAARKLIEKEENWGRGYYGTDKDGEVLTVDHGMACEFGNPQNEVVPDCFCGMGAACYASPDTDTFLDTGKVLVKAIELVIPGDSRVRRGEGMDGFYKFNDDERTSHAEVLAVYDKAIELAKEAS